MAGPSERARPVTWLSFQAGATWSSSRFTRDASLRRPRLQAPPRTRRWRFHASWSRRRISSALVSPHCWKDALFFPSVWTSRGSSAFGPSLSRSAMSYRAHRIFKVLRVSMNETKAVPLSDDRIQPLPSHGHEDYEKLIKELVKTARTCPRCLLARFEGPYRDRDFAVVAHSPGTPSDKPRLSLLKQRWDEMAARVTRLEGVAGIATDTPASDRMDLSRARRGRSNVL